MAAPGGIRGAQRKVPDVIKVVAGGVVAATLTLVGSVAWIAASGQPADHITAWATVAYSVAAIATFGVLLFAGVGAWIAAGYARGQVDLMTTARESSLIVALLEKWHDERFVEAKRLVSKSSDGDDLRQKMLSLEYDKTWYQLMMIPEFLEVVGILWDHKVITIGLIKDLFGEAIITLWQYFAPYVRERLRPAQPTAFERFEKLAEQLKQLQPKAEN